MECAKHSWYARESIDEVNNETNTVTAMSLGINTQALSMAESRQSLDSHLGIFKITNGTHIIRPRSDIDDDLDNYVTYNHSNAPTNYSKVQEL